ncbi:hypothetical protein ACCC88_11935 [Sphingomonas sp. Sphisp140]
MRVVRDAGPKVRTTIEGTAEVVRPSAPAAAPAAKAGLPMMQAVLFLLACIGGSVAVIIIRPFGLG